MSIGRLLRVLMAALVFAATACSPSTGGLPAVEDILAEAETSLAGVAGSPTVEECASALGDLRRLKTELYPVEVDPVLGEALDRWFLTAGSSMFACAASRHFDYAPLERAKASAWVLLQDGGGGVTRRVHDPRRERDRSNGEG